MRKPITDDRCIACDSTTISPLGPRAYLCESCGYEGGSGYKQYRAQAQKKRIERLSPRDQVSSAIKDLKEAKLLLLGAEGIITNAESLSRRDMMRSPDGLPTKQGSQKQLVFMTAHRDILLSEQLVRSAALKLKEDIKFSGISVDFDSWAFRNDVSITNLPSTERRADREVHGHIKAAEEHVHEMIELIENTLIKAKRRAKL